MSKSTPVDSRCIHICLALSKSEPISLKDLAGIDISEIKGVGDKKKDALETRDIRNVLDLVQYYPRRWIDRTNEARIADIILGVETLVLARVDRVDSRRIKGNKTMVNVRVADDTGKMSLTFFNQPWREKQLKPGMQISIFGKPEEYRGYLQMTNPVVDLIGDRTGRIVPIYQQSEKAKIFTWDIAAWVESALRRCEARGIADPVPEKYREKYSLIDRHDALFGIHLPDTMEVRNEARRRLAFDEVFRIQVLLVQRKRALERAARSISHRTDGPLIDRFRDQLPFPLTAAQQRVISEITGDLASSRTMHRLLQGDVGSGKTVVAVWTMLCAVQGGHQAALMAPTEVLAEQHAAGVSQLLEGLMIPDETNLLGDRPLRVEMLTNRVTGESRRSVLAGLASGEVDIVIGTHALIQDKVSFNDLGVVVVDEQHRFGVEQRAALRDRAITSDRSSTPDVLSMTATPIPRTAAMTVYGDLDVSVIDELPPGRTPIVTRAVNTPVVEAEMWNDVRERLTRGEQAYVVCPLIEESEKLQVSSAEETFDVLQRGELKDHKVGLLHGRMSSNEKDDTMTRFRNGDLDVLVATTVIEVGVDVPNATTMVILDANRFGIAQLHQLRGRVGRGSLRSTCWLQTSEDEIGPRIEALVSTTNGFELAEVDLELRGEGTIMGAEQKGRSDLRLASLVSDLDLIQAARDAAFDLVDADPDLKMHSMLAEEIELLFSQEDEDYLQKS